MARLTAWLALLGCMALPTGLLGCEDETTSPTHDAAADASADSAVDAGPSTVFPADVEQRYREIRDCRPSHEHDLRYVRTLVSEDAEAPFAALSPDLPYPVGATLVKLEYDDDACTTLLGYTAYRKLAPGENPAGNDWLWQKLDAERRVQEEGAPFRCINCHTFHCAPPYGYDLTCAEEL